MPEAFGDDFSSAAGRARQRLGVAAPRRCRAPAGADARRRARDPVAFLNAGSGARTAGLLGRRAAGLSCAEAARRQRELAPRGSTDRQFIAALACARSLSSRDRAIGIRRSRRAPRHVLVRIAPCPPARPYRTRRAGRALSPARHRRRGDLRRPRQDRPARGDPRHALDHRGGEVDGHVVPARLDPGRRAEPIARERRRRVGDRRRARRRQHAHRARPRADRRLPPHRGDRGARRARRTSPACSQLATPPPRPSASRRRSRSTP